VFFLGDYCYFGLAVGFSCGCGGVYACCVGADDDYAFRHLFAFIF
jgi:hypothetical protein